MVSAMPGCAMPRLHTKTSHPYSVDSPQGTKTWYRDFYAPSGEVGQDKEVLSPGGKSLLFQQVIKETAPPGTIRNGKRRRSQQLKDHRKKQKKKGVVRGAAENAKIFESEVKNAPHLQGWRTQKRVRVN